MNLTEARALGYQRGMEAVAAITRVPPRDKATVNCDCIAGEMCDLCLSFAANTKEETRRMRSKAEWFKIMDQFKAFRNPQRIEEVFEEGSSDGVRDAVKDRLKAEAKSI